MVKIHPYSEYQELDSCISIIQKGLYHCSFYWTYANLYDFEQHIQGMLHNSKKSKIELEIETNQYLSKWQRNIIKHIIDSFYNTTRDDYRNVVFCWSDLFKNINIYIYYYILDQGTTWLKQTIYQIYDEYDVNGLKKLYQFFVRAYLNIDRVHKFEYCHKGFTLIHKLIQTKCNKVRIDNYEILYVLENYIQYDYDIKIHINKLYKEYMNLLYKNVFMILNVDTDSAFKEQNKRVINFLNIILNDEISYNKKTICESLRLNYLYNIYYYCIPKQHIKQNCILSFLASFILKKEYIVKKLEKHSKMFIDKYFTTVIELSRVLKKENVKKIIRTINNFENMFIENGKIQHISVNVIHLFA